MGKKKQNNLSRYDIKVKEKKRGKNKDIFGVPIDGKKKKKKKKKDGIEKFARKTMKPVQEKTVGEIIETNYTLEYMLDSPVTGAPVGIYVFEYIDDLGFTQTLQVVKVGYDEPKLIDLMTGNDVTNYGFRYLKVYEEYEMEYINDIIFEKYAEEVMASEEDDEYDAYEQDWLDEQYRRHALAMLAQGTINHAQPIVKEYEGPVDVIEGLQPSIENGLNISAVEIVKDSHVATCDDTVNDDSLTAVISVDVSKDITETNELVEEEVDIEVTVDVATVEETNEPIGEENANEHH